MRNYKSILDATVTKDTVYQGMPRASIINNGDGFYYATDGFVLVRIEAARIAESLPENKFEAIYRLYPTTNVDAVLTIPAKIIKDSRKVKPHWLCGGIHSGVFSVTTQGVYTVLEKVYECSIDIMPSDYAINFNLLRSVVKYSKTVELKLRYMSRYYLPAEFSTDDGVTGLIQTLSLKKALIIWKD